jgi:hypothetical protein
MWLKYDEARSLLKFLVKLGEKNRSLFRTSITSLLDPYDLSKLSIGPKWRYIESDSNDFELGGDGGVMSGAGQLAAVLWPSLKRERPCCLGGKCS